MTERKTIVFSTLKPHPQQVMATEQVHSDSWKQTYRSIVCRLQDEIKEYYEWTVRNLPYVVLAVCAVVGGRAWWYSSLYFQGKYTEFDELLKASIESSPCVNLILTVGLFCVMALLLIHVCFFHPRWWHLPAYAITATYIYVIPQWVAVDFVLFNWSHPVLIVSGLLIIFVCESFILTMNHFTKRELVKLPSGDDGFLVKMADSEMERTNWEEFIKIIFRLIGEKQLEKESFAIGIAGSWGSGKTTFYEQVKKYLDASGQFEICEFKPWQILEPSRIAPEFFNEFAKAVNRKDERWKPELNKILARYAQLLTEIPQISAWAKFITLCFNPGPKTTLEDLRLEVDALMEKQETYVAVMIDDLDRLKREELIEIMRLVRASANFRHVLFILVYDKEHFVKELGGDKDKVEYLKKIVNVEFNLPLIENYKYRDLIMKNIIKIVPNLQNAQIKELNKACRVKNSANDNILLTIYSHNFRDILRFSNHFGLVLRHLQKQEILDKFSLRDLFWLEILYYYEEDTYKQLQSPQWILLDTVEEPLAKQQYLTLRESKINDANSNLPVSDILRELFDPAKKDNANSIVWRNNFNNYFAHRLLDNAVSMTQFADFVEQTKRSKDVREQVKKWCRGHMRISLLNVIKNYPHNNVFESKRAAKNYMRVLFALLKKDLKEFDADELKSLLHEKCRIPYYKRIDTGEIKIWLKRMISIRPDIKWNYLLSAMCPMSKEDFENISSRKGKSYLLNHNDLIELAILNYTRRFKNRNMPVAELFNPVNDYTIFISSLSYLRMASARKNSTFEVYDNLIGAYVLKQLEKRGRKYKLSENTFMLIYENLLLLANTNEQMDKETLKRTIRITIEKTLGSVEGFEAFLQEHCYLGESHVLLCKNIGVNLRSQADMRYN